jgi:hypothetical protein
VRGAVGDHGRPSAAAGAPWRGGAASLRILAGSDPDAPDSTGAWKRLHALSRGEAVSAMLNPPERKS